MNYIEFTVLKAFTSEFKLHTNPVKTFNGICEWLTSITFSVIWLSVLISVTQEWHYRGLVYKFFLINYRVKVFVCPVPKISHVTIKWHRRASYLGRFTLWHNGCRAIQLGKFTLWPNGHCTKPGLMHAPGVADSLQRE